jgi:hypothetical protein
MLLVVEMKTNFAEVEYLALGSEYFLANVITVHTETTGTYMFFIPGEMRS